MNELCQYGELTRQSTNIPTHAWCVVDVETTALNPRDGRVIEVAAVRLSPDGQIVDEYATLINPGVRDTGATHVHGIEMSDLADAPDATQVWTAVASRMEGAVLVAHNLEFEEGWILQELQRAGLSTTIAPVGLDTLLTARAQIVGFPYRLDNVYSMMTGRWLRGGHAALQDARATAAILRAFLESGKVGWRGGEPLSVPYVPACGPVKARIAEVEGVEFSLPRIVAGLPAMIDPPAPHTDKADAYVAALRAALSDRQISSKERRTLEQLASDAGFTQDTLRATHQQVLAGMRADAEADGVVTTAETGLLWAAAQELDTTDAIADLATVPPISAALRGERVIVTTDTRDGEDLRGWIANHGGKVAVNITKTVTLVIDDDPSDKVRAKADEHGITIVTVEQARIDLQARVDNHVDDPADLDEDWWAPEPAEWRAEEFPQDMVIGRFGPDAAYSTLAELKSGSWGSDVVATIGGRPIRVDSSTTTGPSITRSAGQALTPEQQQAKSLRSQAMWSMWLSILGICMITAVVGVILGIITLLAARKAGLPRPGMALAGVIIGAGWLLLGLVAQFT